MHIYIWFSISTGRNAWKAFSTVESFSKLNLYWFFPARQRKSSRDKGVVEDDEEIASESEKEEDGLDHLASRDTSFLGKRKLEEEDFENIFAKRHASFRTFR